MIKKKTTIKFLMKRKKNLKRNYAHECLQMLIMNEDWFLNGILSTYAI